MKRGIAVVITTFLPNPAIRGPPAHLVAPDLRAPGDMKGTFPRDPGLDGAP
ncbi:MAG: hypothetical protein KBE65_19735 [Phycisphaerae bacterium]|nr:hypothetical protein [Phycisphaerae bacterium]